MLIYLYDESGSPIGLQYRTNSYEAGVFDTYYFEKNLFGDVVGVYNSSGVKVGTYIYDAWGNFTIKVASTATTLEKRIVQNYNPFRYRGYFYDIETGLYYLQSRYYDPATGRFINADGLVSTGTGLLGYNMYAYCNNNPIMYVDPAGESIGGVILGLLLIGGIGLLFTSCTSGDTEEEIIEDNHTGYSDIAVCESRALHDLEVAARNDPNGYEWGTFIFEENGRYYYTQAYHTKKKDRITKRINHVYDFHPDATIIGFYHTHPHDENEYAFHTNEISEMLSRGDMYDHYVVALDRKYTQLYRYTPQDGATLETTVAVRRWDPVYH